MKANAERLGAVFGRADRFVIPEFQRPYSWAEDEVGQLWGDLRGAFDDDRGAGADARAEDYFLGPMVITTESHKSGTTHAYVVDGQQRLTTLQVLLWIALDVLKGATTDEEQDMVLRLKSHLTTGRAQKFVPAREDQANFRAITEGAQVDRSRLLGKCAHLLRERLAEIAEDRSDLVAFLGFILGRTYVVLVEADSFASAWDLFIGLNGKGKPLTAGDLIKAFVCGRSADGQQMADVWGERVLPLENDTTAALLDVVRVGTGNVGSEQKLFQDFERAWDARQVDGTLLSDGALTYAQLWRADYDKINGLGQGHRALRGMRSLDRRDHGSVLVALGATYGFEFVLRAELLRAIEAFQLWMAVRGKRGRERAFTQLANEIRTERVTRRDAVVRFAAVMRDQAPPRDEVLHAVETAAYPGRIMKFIAREYEEGVRAKRRIEDVQYEHIMPKTGTDFWFAAAGTSDRAEYDRIVNNIGNIVPLDQATNIVGKNDPWDVKRQLYLTNVAHWQAGVLALEFPTAWTPENIRARASKIATWAVETRWNLPELLADLDRWIGTL